MKILVKILLTFILFCGVFTNCLSETSFDISVFDNLEDAEITQNNDGTIFVSPKNHCTAETDSAYVSSIMPNVEFEPFMFVDNTHTTHFGCRFRVLLNRQANISQVDWYFPTLPITAPWTRTTKNIEDGKVTGGNVTIYPASIEGFSGSLDVKTYFNPMVSLIETGGGFEGANQVLDDFSVIYDRFTLTLAYHDEYLNRGGVEWWAVDCVPVIRLASNTQMIEFNMPREMVELFVEWYEYYLSIR